MGLLARVHARSYTQGPFSLKDPELNRLYGVGSRTIAGPVVNEHTAFMCAAVWDAVNQIASDVAKLPLNLMIERGGKKEVYAESRTHRMMHYSPNPETRSMVFRRTLLTHALITNGGYAEIVRDENGLPTAAWNIEPHRVQVFRDNERPGQPLRYRVDGDRILTPRQMLHIHGLGWDGIVGFELVKVARQAIGLAMASEHFASAFFGAGTRFGGVLSSDQDLSPDQKEEIRQNIEKLHASAERAFRLLVLEAGFKYQETGVKPNEAQMKEIRDQQIMEVARFFNIPLQKLKMNLPGVVSYSSAEQHAQDYWTSCLQTWVTLCEQEFNAKLVPTLEIGRQYFKHNERALMRIDFKSQSEALGIMRDKGIISADEWRALLDMNPQPEGQGELILVQAAQIPVKLLEKQVEAQIEQMTAPEPEPEPAPATTGDEDERKRLIALAEAAEANAREAREALQAAQDERDLAIAAITSERDAEAEALKAAAETAQARVVALESERDRLDAAKSVMEKAADEARQAHEETVAKLASSESVADEERQAREEAEQRAKALVDETAAKLAEIGREKTETEARVAEAQAEAERVAAEREAALSAKDAEIERLKQESAQAAEELNAALEAERQARERAEVAAKTAEDESRQALESAEGLVAQLTADLESLREAKAEAEQAGQALAEETAGKLTEAERRLEEATAELTALRERQAEAEAERVSAVEAERKAAEVASGQAEVAKQAAEDALARLAEAEQRLKDVEAQIAADAVRQEETARLTAELEAASVAAREAVAEAERTAAEQEAAAKTLADSLKAEREAREALEAALKAAQEAERERRIAVLTAARSSLEDAVGRLVRADVEKARQKQATPAKLRRWLSDYPELQEARAVEVLRPAVRVHLAALRSTEDLGDTVARLAKEHVEAFTALMRHALEADPVDFSVDLDRALTRWETNRASTVADALLLKEIRDVQ